MDVLLPQRILCLCPREPRGSVCFNAVMTQPFGKVLPPELEVSLSGIKASTIEA
jgi:hypothetical protein